ncbi:MAG: ribonuclease HII [Candidatus Omnitrophica bacterium]|nr:ribonuclease HII [Candidatus Omnitrophota bacterium]
MLYYEKKLKKAGYDVIIGVDESGRGPLAGPVVAVAATLKTTHFENRIDDSKKLTPLLREKAFFELLDKSLFGIGIVSERIIDTLNIRQATSIAMQQAIENLLEKLRPLKNKRIHILIDGDIRPEIKQPFTNIIKGDSRSKSIASASILAKVIRDRIMLLYDKVYPGYGFLRHKGYPTKEHRTILNRRGPTLIHRRSFVCV